MSEPVWTDAPRACGDPECDGTAEPETDGDTGWWECTSCGYVAAYVRLPSAPADGCQLGIPEAVRRAAEPPKRQQVLIPTIGRRPE